MVVTGQQGRHGELERERHGAALALGGEGAGRDAVEPDRDVVTLGPHPCLAEPDLLLTAGHERLQHGGGGAG